MGAFLSGRQLDINVRHSFIVASRALGGSIIIGVAHGDGYGLIFGKTGFAVKGRGDPHHSIFIAFADFTLVNRDRETCGRFVIVRDRYLHILRRLVFVVGAVRAYPVVYGGGAPVVDVVDWVIHCGHCNSLGGFPVVLIKRQARAVYRDDFFILACHIDRYLTCGFTCQNHFVGVLVLLRVAGF